MSTTTYHSPLPTHFSGVLVGLVMLLAASGFSASPARRAHDFHVSYGRLAVEGSTAVLQIRFFRDDLEEALGARTGSSALRLSADPATDRLFHDYFAEKFQLLQGDVALNGTIIGSGEDSIDREPAWWYLIRFTAPTTIAGFKVRNTLLLDAFEDQKNVLRVLRTGDVSPEAVTFSAELFEADF